MVRHWFKVIVLTKHSGLLMWKKLRIEENNIMSFLFLSKFLHHWRFASQYHGRVLGLFSTQFGDLNRKGALPPVFTGRRTALNPCQQWTSIARQTICPGRLQFPPPPPFFFFLSFFFFFFFLRFLLLFFSLKKSFLLRCVRSNARLSSWKAESSHLHSARPLFFSFFCRAGRKDWIIWRAYVEALITGKSQKECDHLKITDS